MTPRGFALVTVLWITLIMGLLVAAMAEVAARSARGATLTKAQLEAQMLVDQGLNRAIWVLKTQNLPRLRADGLVWQIPGATGDIALRIVAADALVDLNSATDAVLNDLARAIAQRVGDFDQQADLAQALVALRGRALSPLDVTELVAGHPISRTDAYAIAGLVTVGSGKHAPDVTMAPEPILRDLLGLTSDQTDTIQEARRQSGASPVPTPPHYEDPQFTSDARPRGTVWHIAVAAGVRGAEVRAGQVWVVYLPLPETRPDQPYQVMARWPLPVDDGVFVALDGADTQDNSP